MRNAEASRQKILTAALAEFAAHGVAGGRVERIAEAAKCNKNLIYIYFESKEGLFTAVLQKYLAGAYEDHPFTPEDLPAYALKAFDLAMAHPEIIRLLAWYSLEQIEAPVPERTASRDAKIEALSKAQKANRVGNSFSPGFLLTATMALATAWTASAPYASLDPDGSSRPAVLRRQLAEAVRLLASAKK